MNIVNKILITAFICVCPQLSLASGSHNHGHQDEEEQEDGVTYIDNNMAKQVGIKTDTAGPKVLHQTISSYGRLTTGPEQIGRVRARFPGVIKSIKVTIGDRVKTGDIVALVESNESLKNYKVRAPISGTVIHQAATVGETIQDQELFTISDYDHLQAELRIFPSQQKKLAIGQWVHIFFEGHQYEATISHLLPVEGNAPYIKAITKLHGSHANLFPGLMIEGRIVISEFETPLAVVNAGLQSMDGEIGVFVEEEGKYSFMPLMLGQADDEYTEVLSGIDSGANYVVVNSYLIKADIEKSEAEHNH